MIAAGLVVSGLGAAIIVAFVLGIATGVLIAWLTTR